MFESVKVAAFAVVFFYCNLHSVALADPSPRSPTISGQVIQARSGEDIALVEAPLPRNVEVLQDVKAGDVIRTNELGQIALLFADRTQIRLSRNSVLVVKEVRADGGVTLDLNSGEMYGRAARGGSGVTINTPSAGAAIRGTDWTLSVSATRTTLSVIEGIVDLANAQGKVTVTEGESAAATLGSAPSKIVTVGKNIREQMLFNIRLNSAFDQSMSSTADVRRLADADRRLNSTSRSRWRTDDYVLAAEVAFGRVGRNAAQTAIADARTRTLSREQNARLFLIEGKVAAHDHRYKEATSLFDRAHSGLRGNARTEAEYLAYFARALANPTRAYTPPASSGSLAAVLGQDTIAAILQSPQKALDVLKRHEGQYGNDVRYQAAIANRALLASDFETMAAAIAKGEKLDPDDARRKGFVPQLRQGRYKGSSGRSAPRRRA